MNVMFQKVLNILSEIVMGGMVLETNMHEICSRFQEQDKLEKSEVYICFTSISWRGNKTVNQFYWHVILYFKRVNIVSRCYVKNKYSKKKTMKINMCNY